VPEADCVGADRQLGASDRPVALGARPASVGVPLADEAEGAFRTLGGARESRPSVYLTLEDVSLSEHPGVVYAVYLNKPEDVRGADARLYRAGLLSFFGLLRSHAGGDAGARPPASVYDVTSVVAFLRARGDWDPARAQVTFEPLGLAPGGGGSGYDAVRDYLTDEAKVRVGRVCLSAR
jgi:hypothetical protein